MKKVINYSKTRLKSEWINITDATSDDGGRDWYIKDYKCAQCGHRIRTYRINMHGEHRYCGFCGARMVKEV